MAILTALLPFTLTAAAQESQLQLAQPRAIPPQQVQPRQIAPQQAQPSQPAQASPAPIHPLQASSPALAPPSRLILVLPFENHSGQANLDWVGESFPFTLNQRLAAAGFLPVSRDDRMYALDHLGLPLDFKPSRATTLRIAQTLDADYVILGSFTTQNQRISAQAQVLDIHALKMSQPVQDSSQVERLLDLENAIAWKLARQMLPGYSVAEATFIAASSSVKIDAFENYIRGQVETVPSERLQHLKLAVQIAPGFAPAVLALGKTYYADQQFEKASATLASIPSSEPLALEAGFYLGLSYFNSAHYAKAEGAFASVASRLPLPEVVNNQGVAESRQGKDAGALFTQAVSADPHDPDYRYNLAVSLRRRKDFKGALREVNESLKLKANDPEALELWQLLMKETAAAPSASAPDPARAALASATPASAPPASASPVSAASASAASVSAASAPASTASANPSAESTSQSASQSTSQSASGSTSGRATDAADSVQPLERIRRTYSEASFRQAAFELDQMRALRMSTLAPATQAAQLAQLGSDYLAQGLVLEAEREFQAALAQNNNNAQAHVGLAQIREQSGDATQARSEARTSLELKPSVAAYLVLARLDMRENQLPAAAEEVSRALRLEPGNAAVAGMRQALVAKGQQLPGTLDQ